MVFKASSSSGSVIFENVFSSSETLTLPSISLRMLRRSRDRSLVLPVTSIRPLPVLVRIDRRFILWWVSWLSRPPQSSAAYYRQVGGPQGERLPERDRTAARRALRARASIPAAPGRLDHEAVPGIHLDLIAAFQLHDLSAGAAHPVAPRLAGCAARHAVGRDAPVPGENRGGHRLQKAHPADCAVSSAPAPGAAAPAADLKVFQQHRKAPLEHLRVGQA